MRYACDNCFCEVNSPGLCNVCEALLDGQRGWFAKELFREWSGHKAATVDEVFRREGVYLNWLKDYHTRSKAQARKRAKHGF